MKMKHKYELMAIISSRITDGEIDKRLKGLKELLGEEVVFEELWGMRPFAFAIKKQDKGSYVVWNFMAEAEMVKDLEKHLQLYPDLLRFLLCRVPDDYTPMPLEKIEAGLEELKKQKADKRGGRGGPPAPTPRPAPMPATPAPAPAPAPAPVPVSPAVPARSFDQKLEDILSNDDLGL